MVVQKETRLVETVLQTLIFSQAINMPYDILSHVNCKGPRRVKTAWKKKYKVGELQLPVFKFYDTAIVSNTYSSSKLETATNVRQQVNE